MIFLFHKWMVVLLLPVLTGLPTFSKPHAHPFYVGVVEVAHNKTAATLEISCKLIAEDAADVLEKDYKTVVDFSVAAQAKKIDGLLADYIPKHLALQANGAAQTLRYIGFERDAESLYCYFEVSNVAVLKKLGITNSLLYDFTEKQINIMHVLVAGNRKSAKLDYPNTQTTFVFE